MTKERSRKIFDRLKKYHGDPRPDLRFRGIYELSVAVVLSAQTTDKQVNSVTPGLFEKYPDYTRLASAKVRDVERIIKSTGFYRHKARNIIGLAAGVMEGFGGKLPSTREELMRLPGIGRKSANVILSVGFGIPALAVDTHIIRIANRIGYADTKDPDRVEESLTSMIPESEWTTAHLVLIRHGRTVCPARAPRCGECPVSALCDYARTAP